MQHVSNATTQPHTSRADDLFAAVRNQPKSFEKSTTLLEAAKEFHKDSRFVEAVQVANELSSQEPYLTEEIQKRCGEILELASVPLREITKQDFKAHHQEVMQGLDEKTRARIPTFFEEHDTNSCQCYGLPYILYKDDSSWFYIPCGSFMQSYGDPIDYAIAKSSYEGMVAFIEKLSEDSIIEYGSDGVVCTLGHERALLYAEKMYEHTSSREFKESFERALVGVLFIKLAQPIQPEEYFKRALTEEARCKFQRDERLLRDLTLHNHMRAEYNKNGYYDQPENFWLYSYAVRTKFFSSKKAKEIAQELVTNDWDFNRLSEGTKELFGKFAWKMTAEHISEYGAKSVYEKQFEQINSLLECIIVLSEKYPQFKDTAFNRLLSHHEKSDHFPNRKFDRYFYHFNPAHTLLHAIESLQPQYEFHDFWINRIQNARGSDEAFLAFKGLVRAAPFGSERDAYIVEGIAALEERDESGFSQEPLKDPDRDWREWFVYAYQIYPYLVSDQSKIPVRSSGAPLRIMTIEKQNRISDNEINCTIKTYTAHGVEERDAIFYLDKNTFIEPDLEVFKNGVRA